MMQIKRWTPKFKNILLDFVSGIGLYWLFVELASYSSNGGTDIYSKSVVVTLVAFSLVLIIAVIKNRPKKSFCYKLRDKDNFIEVKVCDAFDNIGALVVPINDSLDVALGGNVKKAKSIQNKVIKDYYHGKASHLGTDIANKIDIGEKHDMGTVVEIDQDHKTFYFLVNSRKKENNRVESTIDDFLLSLSKLWEYIASESGRNDVVTIPVIGTRHGRISNLDRSSAIKEIIRSYIESSKYLNIADKLIVSIYPDDLSKSGINLNEINEYLRYSCKHYQKTEYDRPVGKGISGQLVKEVKN